MAFPVFVCLLGVCAGLTLTGQRAVAAIINVPADFPTIQQAIDASSDLDTIIVAAGTYNENVIFEGHRVTVRSADPTDPAAVAATIIDGGANGPVVTFFDGENRDAVLDGLTVRNGSTQFVHGAGVYIVNASPVIKRCVIENNTAAFSGGGIGCTGVFASPLIVQNIIRNNQATANQGGGISCNGAPAVILYNEVHDNTAVFGGGIMLINAAATVHNNFIHHNTADSGGGGLRAEGSGSATLRHNTVADNVSTTTGAGGIDVTGSVPTVSNSIVWANGDDLSGVTATYSDIEDGDAGLGNISADPLFVGATDYHLQTTSPCINTGDPGFVPDAGETDIDGETRIQNGRVEMGADEVAVGVGLALNVSASPEQNVAVVVTPVDTGGLDDGVTPFLRTYNAGTLVALTIQPADLSNFVRWSVDGVDQPLGQATAFVTMDDAHAAVAHFGAVGTIKVAAQGLGDYDTIQAAINAAVNGDVIIVCPGVYHERINLLGKSITVQSLDPDDPTVVAATVIDGDAGGSVVTFNSAEDESTILRGFTITDGQANNGGGVYAFTDTNNFTSPTIEKCVIENNAAGQAGGGLYLQFGAAQILNNIIRNNTAISGAGVATADISGQTEHNPFLGGNIIHSNVASGSGGGVLISFNALASLRSNVIVDNDALSGDGVYTSSQGAFIEMCTIADNAGEGVRRASGTVAITNTILWNNGDDLVSATATYSNIEDGDAGTGNLSVNPKFADPGAVVYNLMPDSPCIDAGDPLTFVFFGETDIDGDDRRINGTVDMGADEVDVVAGAFTLWMTSTPDPGVGVTFSPGDFLGAGPGVTDMFRWFEDVTPAQLVTVTAPGAAVGRTFRRWSLDGTNQAVGNADVLGLMNKHHTVRAQYVPQLDVNSNVTAVGITVDTADLDGNQNGSTDFSRVYNVGTSVTLTAPASAGAGPFNLVGWQLDGVDQGASTMVTVALDKSRTATAIYDTPTHVLTVNATEPAVIDVSLEDVNGDSDGSAPAAFTRTYHEGTTVTLTAPPTSCTEAFLHWQLDGLPQAAGDLALDVLMDADHTATAVYDAATVTSDCNTNGVDDQCEVYTGVSPDCNGNFVPDECDVAGATSEDCNTNAVPDECDIAGGASQDCNGNDVPDECDLAGGTSDDCNANSLPDDCDVGDIYLLDDGSIENTVGASGGGDMLWLNHFTVAPNFETIEWVSLSWGASVSNGSSTTLLVYDDPNNDGNPVDGVLLHSSVVSSTNAGSATPTRFAIPPTLVGSAGDNFFVGALITHGNGVFPAALDQTPPSLQRSWAVAAFGGTININNLSFTPPTLIDSLGFPGNWLVRAGVGIDCNANGVPDECDTGEDCNTSGVPDVCDIAGPTSEDCNVNGIADECEPECNGNSVPDECDIAAGTSDDCNINDVPDECDIAAGTSLDDNANDVPDECDDNRVFMVRAGEDGLAPVEGNTVMSMAPGTIATVELWAGDTGPNLAAGYQMSIPGSATPVGATGTVSYVNNPGVGDSVFIDFLRTDWIFAGVPGVQIFYSETGLPLGFAMIALALQYPGTALSGTAYLGEFDLAASPDACGVFTLGFIPDGQPPNGGSGITTPDGAGQVPARYMPMEITIEQPNDNCVDAIPLSGNTVVQNYDTSCAVLDGVAHACGTLDPDVWYRYTATCTGNLTIDTLSNCTFDAALAVYAAGAGCTPSDLDLDQCADVPAACESITTFVNTGDVLYIRIGSTVGQAGTGTLTITGETAGAPANDQCVSATPVTGDLVVENFNTACTEQDGVVHACGDIDLDIWYAYTASCTGDLVVDTLANCTIDTALALYAPGAGCVPGDLDLLQCADDAGACESITTPVETGEVFLIRVGSVAGNAGAGTLTVECIPQQCTVAQDCGDQDLDGVIDDPCIWYDCVDTNCIQIDRIFGDAGGAFGACQIDGFANIHDRNHVLSCFANLNTCASINMDLGGPFGDCPPDGFCNIHDANHALAAFSDLTTCSCPLGAMPSHEPVVVASASLTAVARNAIVMPGDSVLVDVYIDKALNDLRGYQLQIGERGGRSGILELTDILIEDRWDHAFNALDDGFSAFNLAGGRMLNGLEGGGVRTRDRAYLATFVFRASRGAAGDFVVDVLVDDSPQNQTFLIATNDGKIAVAGTTPAVVTIRPALTRELR